MFTGIVRGTFPIALIERTGRFSRITVSLTPELLKGIEQGASVAINGCCLTVTDFDDDSASFDVMQETLRVTNLGDLQEGQLVNIERAARFGDEIGGHLLSGHIHDTVEVVDVIHEPNNATVFFSFAEQWQDYLMPKGYAALNGCSLTIGEQVKDQRFCVHLIPETLRLTTFDGIQVGTKVNLEIDSQTQAVVDTVKKYIKASD